MKKERIIFLVSLLILGFGFMAQSALASEPIPINGCTRIDTPGSYILTKNIRGSVYCIYIAASDVIFDGAGHTIDGGTGVVVYSGTGQPSTNVTVKNLTITNCNYGIWAMGAQNVRIENNTASSCSYGIRIDGISYSTISNNTVSLNSSGIYIYGISYSTISNNTANLNSSSGIYLCGGSHSNTVTDNTANSNSYGIYLYSLSYNNTLTNNTVNSNSYGIYLAGEYINNNKIYNNNFINNSTQAYVSVWGYYWYEWKNVFNLAAPIGGNYWSNFDTPDKGCSDTDNNGFCDAPYVFSGGVDNLPWTKQILDSDGDGDGNPNNPKIEDFAAVIKNLNLPKGIETALTSKVNNAEMLLEKGNNEAAVNILGAFINHVEAQSGKKISEGDANILIAYAKNLIAQIEGP